MDPKWPCSMPAWSPGVTGRNKTVSDFQAALKWAKSMDSAEMVAVKGGGYKFVT